MVYNMVCEIVIAFERFLGYHAGENHGSQISYTKRAKEDEGKRLIL
jgi:hypothetical protein